MSQLATIVDTKALWETVVASMIAGIGVTFVFSLAIYGAARFSEMAREGRQSSALGFGALALVAIGAFLGAIVFGIIVMTSK
jgi:MFS family permease